jgi:hypothetical protein
MLDRLTLFRIEIRKIRDLGTLKRASGNGWPLVTGRIGQIERRIFTIGRAVSGLLARLR